MTELKTLKDIAKYSFNPHAKESDDPFQHEEDMVRIDELKEEAIKWMNSYLRIENKPDMVLPCGHVSNWIKHFFNITEEDLK